MLLPKELSEEMALKWEAFCAAALNAHIAFQNDSAFVQTLKTVFVYSDFFAKGVTRNPLVLKNLIDSGELERKYTPEIILSKLQKRLSDPEPPQTEEQLSTLLRRFRLQEMLRIAWRDLTGFADLFETMADLSALADACLEKALSLLYEWSCNTKGVPVDHNGDPQQLVVIGMGKLGGRELNFSSDVDLIFTFAKSGETRSCPSPIGNDEFFTHLCRRLVHLIGTATSDGIVFRVDTRLRPYGENGPIVMSFDAMESYYQIQGREWERYAWIKARVVAGDQKAGKEIIERLKPFVYRKYLDYGVFDSLRDMKQKISLEVTRTGMLDNIKLGPGGIREVEFFGQMFQLIRGGVSPVLQKNRILEVLEVLMEEGIISQDIRETLSTAYVFLRNVEHRIQEFSDQQTHNLPQDPAGRARLALSMGFSGWSSFEKKLRRHMRGVHGHFDELLGGNGSDEVAHSDAGLQNLVDFWKLVGTHGAPSELPASLQYDDPATVVRILEDLRQNPATRALSAEGGKRLDRLIPVVLKQVAVAENPDIVLSRIVDLIKTVQRRTNYLSLLIENPSVLEHLVKLADASPWIVSFVARHPVLLDELLDPRTLYAPPSRQEIEKEIKKRLNQAALDDQESQIIELSIFKQVNTLRVVAADVTGGLPLMRVSDHLTYIAEIVLSNLLDLAWYHLTARHGTPECRLAGKDCDMGFCVIGYGKLGGFELGYGSDLDLVFLHSGTKGMTRDGDQPTDNAHFYSRLGQRIIHSLTASTSAGMLYECDMRLRPDGSSGILVINIDAFEEYQNSKAWIWEHQALIKARAICGDPVLMQYFEDIRKNTLTLKREKDQLQKEVVQMRNRMRNELLLPVNDIFDIKQGEGGLVDIEFIVQYLILLKAHNHQRLTRWTDVVRILEMLVETDILDAQVSSFLNNTYLTYRSEVHRLNLQQRAAKVPEEKFSDLREQVVKIWEDIFFES